MRKASKKSWNESMTDASNSVMDSHRADCQDCEWISAPYIYEKYAIGAGHLHVSDVRNTDGREAHETDADHTVETVDAVYQEDRTDSIGGRQGRIEGVDMAYRAICQSGRDFWESALFYTESLAVDAGGLHAQDERRHGRDDGPEHTSKVVEHRVDTGEIHDRG